MDNKITDVFIPGPAGRLEAKYYKSSKNTISCSVSVTATPAVWRNNE